MSTLQNQVDFLTMMFTFVSIILTWTIVAHVVHHWSDKKK